jgi:ELWxxDGT repeat protein
MTRVVNKQGDTIIAFVANDDARGPEIWLSNGTANGTINYASTLPYSNSLNPKYLTLLNNKIIFWGNSVEYGMEPYAFEMQQVLKVVAPQSTEGSFYIYPNPADKLINIHTAAGSNIQIYNVAGVKMLETTATTENTVLPVSGLIPGLYTISITSKDGTSTGKFIKQ